MTPDRWAEIERLYEASCDLDDERRRAFLDETCGTDTTVRGEVESLLAYDTAAGRFLEPPTPESTAPAVPDGADDRPHAFRWVVRAAAVATIASFLYAAWLLPTPAIAIGWNAAARDGGWYVNAVAAGGPADGLLRRGDRVVSLNGDPNVAQAGPAPHRHRMTAGETYALVVERAGGRLEHRLRVAGRPRDVPYEVVWYAMSLVWCGVALFIGFARPGHAAARLAFASSLAVGLLFLHATITGFGPLLWAPLHVVLGYHFFLLFPTGRSPGGVWRAALWSMYASVAVVLLARYGRWAVNMVYGPEAVTGLVAAYPTWFDLPEPLSLYAYTAALLLMVAVIPWNYRRLADEDQRRRLRWVVLGSAVAIAGQLWWAAGLVLRFFGDPIDIAPVDLSAAAVTIPIAVAYAVVRHRVFDIRVVVRRGLQYLLARRALQAFVAVPAAVVAVTVVSYRDRTIAELVEGSAGYLIWMAGAGVGLGFRRPIGRWLDRRFFREEYDREQVLFGLIEDLKHVESAADLSSLVGARLELALHPKVLHFWYRESGSLTLDYSSGAVVRLADFPSGGGLLARLEHAPSVMEISPASLAALSPPEAAWLRDLGAALLVPVTDSSDRLDGLWLAGERRSEMPYTAGDRRLLQAIARQTAVARENLRLRAQVTEGERVRREVLARLDRAAFNLLKECPDCGRCFDNTDEHCDRDGRPLTTSLPVDRAVGGKYRLDRLLGRGGNGAVYEAYDLGLRRRVAVKVILGRAFGQQTALRRFDREARAAAGLHHPNVVGILDFGRLEGEGAYLVMERVHGSTLRETIDRDGPLTPAAAADWFEQLLDGLAAAHAAGIVHRDLKPENVMRDERDPRAPVVKILDFGLAKVRADLATTGSLTAGGFVVGTLGYMSPEHLQGATVDHRSDIFAVGVMLAEVLTGRRPLAADMYASGPTGLEDAFALPDTTREGRVVTGVVRQCLSRTPQDRPSSAAALRDLLVPALRACRDARLQAPRS